MSMMVMRPRVLLTLPVMLQFLLQFLLLLLRRWRRSTSGCEEVDLQNSLKCPRLEMKRTGLTV